MFKISKLLSLMLAPFMMYADDVDGGGGAAEVDRGDTLSAGAPDTAASDAAAADAAAEAEAIRAAAEAAGGTLAGGAEVDEVVEGETAEQTAARKATGKGMIPVERHSAILAKAREERDAAVAALAQQQKGREVAAVNADITKIEGDITTKETEYNEALVAGEVEKASKIMREIRAMERNMGDMKADMKAAIAESNAIERVRYDTVVERLEEAYPALNPDHDEYDKAQVGEVMELQRAYRVTGLTAAAALQKAVKLLMKPATAKQEDAATVTPRVDAAAVAAAKRTEEATKKALDANKRTPPDAAKVGLDSDKLGGGVLTADAVMKMDQGKFAKIDEETLSRLRGDTI